MRFSHVAILGFAACSLAASLRHSHQALHSRDFLSDVQAWFSHRFQVPRGGDNNNHNNNDNHDHNDNGHDRDHDHDRDHGKGKGSKPSGSSSCDVWSKVKSELNTLYMSGNQCNDLARAAIRAVFHDCGTWNTADGQVGGCDGSLIVGTSPDNELNRTENAGLQTIAGVINGLAIKYNTSVADMIIFSGNAATMLCPGGPRIQTLIGRTDNTTSAPNGRLPNVNAAAGDLVSLFEAKGLNSGDLAALLGAHSTATQFSTDTSRVNASLDSTPGQWDTTYYKQTYQYATTGQTDSDVYVLASDKVLATYQQVGAAFKSFINNERGWNGAYTNAIEKMIMFGVDRSNMVDCTSALG